MKTFFKNTSLNWKILKKDINKLLDIYHLPKLNQYSISYLNCSIAPSEAEAVTKSLQNNKSLKPDDISEEF